jgi:hypothetical protein
MLAAEPKVCGDSGDVGKHRSAGVSPATVVTPAADSFAQPSLRTNGRSPTGASTCRPLSIAAPKKVVTSGAFIVWRGLGLNAFFVMLFVGSVLLCQKAGRGESAPDAA